MNYKKNASAGEYSLLKRFLWLVCIIGIIPASLHQGLYKD